MNYWKSVGWLKDMPLDVQMVISGMCCFGIVGGIVYAIIKALFF